MSVNETVFVRITVCPSELAVRLAALWQLEETMSPPPATVCVALRTAGPSGTTMGTQPNGSVKGSQPGAGGTMKVPSSNHVAVT
jgi:hypothetical protein